MTDSLKRNLNFTSLTFYGTGMILGAGIYSIIGAAAGLAGTSLWISFLIAAFCAGLTALSYCELASLYPHAGAEYVYLSMAFPNNKWLGSLIGLVMSLAGIATASAVALAFGGYLGDFVNFHPTFLAAGLLILLTAINIFGVRESSRANVIFTLIEVAGLVIFISLGLSIESWTEIVSSPAAPTTSILSATAIIIFAFFGFEDIVNLSEDTKNPSREIPRAILWSLGISTSLYILVSLSALSLASIETLSNSNAPLMDSAKAASPVIGKILGICALFSTANTVLIAALAASRSIFGMARDSSLPLALSRLSAKKKSPWVASLFVLAAAVLFLPFGSLEVIAGVSSFATLLGFLSIHIALIRLRFTEADSSRAFKVPISIRKFALIPLIGSASILVLLFQFELKVYLISFICLVLIFGLQFLLKSKPQP